MLRTSSNDPLLDDAHKSLAGMGGVVRIAKAITEKQIVYGVVYAPGEIDTHGETMDAENVEKLCHNFMEVFALTKGAVIDVMHDNETVDAYPVECYIETDEGKDWPVGSWIMAVKIADPVIWEAVKSGELNGFSFEAMVRKLPVVAEVEVDQDLVGKTAVNEMHDHLFFLQFDDDGRVIGGTTSMDDGHRHTIRAGTATDMAKASNGTLHAHRLPV